MMADCNSSSYLYPDLVNQLRAQLAASPTTPNDVHQAFGQQLDR